MNTSGKGILPKNNLFFHLFSLSLPSRKHHGHGLVSLCQNNYKTFQVYTESWNKLKPNYFLATPISTVTHSEFSNFSTFASGAAGCINKTRRLWTTYHFDKKSNSYSIPYNSLNNDKKAMKVIMLLFYEETFLYNI